MRTTITGAIPTSLAAAPEIISQSLLTAGRDYAEAVNILGFDADTGSMAVTTLPQKIVRGDLRFQTTNPVGGRRPDPG